MNSYGSTSTQAQPAADGATGPTEAFAVAPPLPTPGTGGVEELPRTEQHPDRQAGAGCGPAGRRGGLAASRSRVVSSALLMGMLVAVWALSGGGHFWPVWAMIGWSWCLLPDLTRMVEARSAPRAATR
ncbi:hypothetical protein [Serinicoccus kebangsaanensis]|uniref:hypothetical protein n=1 Tax=Serinicoccus kebangsaanensis TaxID=2602069 RepID=UPI00124E22E5|nr:hypothetical protein [Serinicoccus kebangsaanensis]